MNQLIERDEGNTERIERFQSLGAGQYWRAKSSIASQGIDADEVLLISSIRWVDDKPHTIILRAHPNKLGNSYEVVSREGGRTVRSYRTYDEHRFLLDEFLSKFEFEPKADTVRATELKEVQQQIAQLQAELIETQADPARLNHIVEEALREESAASGQSKGKGRCESQLLMTQADAEHASRLATGTVVNAIGSGITESGIEQMKQAANRQHQIATIQAKWIQGKTEQIARTIKAMTPFFEEKAAAALAHTEETRSYVAKLMSGIESLDLYVGRGVEVQTLRSGCSASSDEPLTFMQRKLMMDEELAIWADVNEKFDFSSEEIFFEKLLELPALVDQIFPTPRCVVVMAVTRRAIDYGDTWANLARNEINRKVFLLIRDGENLHRVFSPVESHLGAARLFPARGEDDQIFKGLDGREIKFDDVAYTDRLKEHEAHALHYKRFLLLCCGLDHRLRLFGEFYPGAPSLEFMSLSFQEAYLRFAHDDAQSGHLIGEARPDVMKWMQEKNQHLRSGSRVLCNWKALLNPTTAPGACQLHTNQRHSFWLKYKPVNAHDVAIAYREGQNFCVDIEVHGETSRFKDRSFMCKVNLSAFKDGQWECTDQPFLCLDGVSIEDVRWYIHNRDARRSHLDYIRFFKRALAHLESEHAEESQARGALAKALREGKVADGPEALAIIDQAVIAWRAANRGAALPKYEGQITPEWRSLLDQLYMLAAKNSQVAEVEAFARELGGEPLRLVLSGTAKLIVYVAPTHAERDDRLTPHYWVHRISLDRTKRGLKEKSRRWAILPKRAAAETILHEWDGAAQWMFDNVSHITLEQKQHMMSLASRFRDELNALLSDLSPASFQKNFDEWKAVRVQLNRNTKRVCNPAFAVPIGVIFYPAKQELRYICVGTGNAHGLLHNSTEDDAHRDALKRAYVDLYASLEYARDRFDKHVAQASSWSLFEMPETFIKARRGPYLTRSDADVSPEGERDAPLLGSSLNDFLEQASGKVQTWIAPGVMDDAGQCVLDDMLGHRVPDDFELLDIQSIELTANDGQALPRYCAWFDISTRTNKGNTVSVMDYEKPDGVGDHSYCSSHHHETSRKAAREFIRAKAGAEEIVSASNLPDAPQAPSGVERWYVMRKT